MENEALLFGPLAIVMAAVGGWFAQHWISKKRATVDFITQTEVGSAKWQEEIRRFAELTNDRTHPQPLIALLDPQTEDQYRDRLLISAVLNHFEMVAVGIKRGAFSNVIYRDWSGTPYVDAWTKAEPYITARRDKKKQPTAYEHFEKRAKEWAKKGLGDGRPARSRR